MENLRLVGEGGAAMFLLDRELSQRPVVSDRGMNNPAALLGKTKLDYTGSMSVLNFLAPGAIPQEEFDAIEIEIS